MGNDSNHYSTEFIESGNFKISRADRRILSAYLGTCVGVTLADRKTGVGGLYHILLPEPTGSTDIYDELNYASTGIPIFLRKMYESGAKKENLEASLAGGALVGPVSHNDLNLDIGGRTHQVISDILHQEGIPIIKSETGGFFSCRLNLDLETLGTSVEPIGKYKNGTNKTIYKPSKESIDFAIQKTRPIPQIAMKVIRMLRSDDYSIKEISNEIRQDQVISARVIHVSNSAFASPVRRIDSIDKAIMMLGEKLVVQLVVSTCMEMFYKEYEGGYSLCKGGLFQHALGTGLVAEELAKITGKASSEVAYTAGLLHDIGKVVLDQLVEMALPFFYRGVYEEGVELIDIEDKVFGVKHTEVGGRLADLWNIPDNLKDAILHHHEPERAEIDPELTCIINVANVMMSLFMVGKIIEKNSVLKLDTRLEKIGLKLDNFTKIVDSIPWKKINDMMLT